MAYINTSKIIENSKFNKFHFMILFWCTFLIILDGYDLARLRCDITYFNRRMGTIECKAGAIGSYGYIGVMIGAIFFGPLADRMGRKKVIHGLFYHI